ncbi:MAG: hypothetical protein AB8H80_13790 [Planctomycetota bacterium]
MKRSLLAASVLLLSPTYLLAQDCANLGTILGQGDETVFAIESIGFAFPLDGVTYTDVHVTTNGHFYLSNGGTPAPGGSDFTATPAELATESPRIAPLWNDFDLVNPDSNVWIDNTSGTTCTITWRNATNFGFTDEPGFTVQCRLSPSGLIEFFYGPGVTNRSTDPAWAVGVVGVSPGQGVALPTASDLSAGGTTSDATLFEEFAAFGSFDLANNSISLIPTNPGYAFVVNGPSSNCASAETFGRGCISQAAAFYEDFNPGSSFDLANGTTLTYLRQGSDYLVLDGIPGTFVPPSAAATVIANGDLDGEETVTLSGPMPIPGGTTTELTATTKSLIRLSGTPFGVINFEPSAADLIAEPEPVIAALWNDYDQSDPTGGQIFYEEVAGIAYFTWDGVFTFNNNLIADTFQVQFEIATGTITVVYDTIGLDGFNYIVGYAAGGTTVDPGPSDLSIELPNSFSVFDTEIAPLTLASSAPLLGATWDLTTNNIDAISPLAITFFGSARSPLPTGVPLSTIGINSPGCSVWIDAALLSLDAPNVGGTSLLSLALPNTPSLAGTRFTAQSVCLSLAVPSLILTSNGVDAVLGF